MQSLFYAIGIGAFVGGAAALWLPPHQASHLSELAESLQARAQAFYAPPGQPRRYQPPPQPSSDVDLGEGEDWPSATAGDSEPAAPPPDDTSLPPDDEESYERYEQPPVVERSTEDNPAASAVPFGDYPRTDESAVLDARINQFESAQIIARVGPDVVLAGEVLPEVNRQLAEYAVPPDQVERARLVLMHRELTNLIPNKVLLVDARRKLPAENWTKIEEQVEQAFRDRRIPQLMKKHAARDIKDLAARLQAAGSSLEDQRRQYAESQIAQTWARQNVRAPGEVTYEDLVAYYREHRADYTLEGRARWEQLVVRFDRFPDKESAFAEIAKLGNAILLEGVPFAEVAKEHSDGLTAADGGLRDWTTQGSLVSKDLDAALFALPVGRLSRIIEDEQGFHVIRILERQDAGERSFEDVQTEIREAINKQRFSAEANKYLTTLQKEIPVSTIFDELVEQERQQLSERPTEPPR